MLPESRSFVIRGEDGEEYGPVELAELRDWVRENRAGLGSEVRRADPDATWNSWENYPELVALVAEIQATSSLPPIPGFAIAPLHRRVLAFGMDLILSGILSFPILITLALVYMPDWFQQYKMAYEQQMSPPDMPLHCRVIGSMISDAVLAFYMAGFHAAHGRTPGKSLMHLKVVDVSGGNPPLVKSFVRAVMLVVSIGLFFIPFSYVFFNPQRRAIHDLGADTCVVES